jgi:hypothetical protein
MQREREREREKKQHGDISLIFIHIVDKESVPPSKM